MGDKSKQKYSATGLTIVVLFSIGCLSVHSATMNFDGHFRTESAFFHKLNLGVAGVEADKTYILGRALLRPAIIVDDHFKIFSQWSLLTSPKFTPDATEPLGNGQGGWIFGDRNSAALVLSRAWLEWTSDFGVFRIGRTPVSWGYGLIWDSGNELFDDFQTTYDRIEYRLHFGHIIGGLAYSKPRKGSVFGNSSDQDFYSLHLQYENPELETSMGAIYEKQERSHSQKGDIEKDTGSVGFAPGNKVPYPLANNIIDLYVKKSAGYFTFGGEIAWLTGRAFDYDNSGKDDELNALGIFATTSFEYHKIRVFMDFLFAQGDSNLNSPELSGFVLLHRNRRPGLILGHELLGNTLTGSAKDTVGHGSLVAYGNKDSYSGVFYFRPGFRIDWSQAWSTGVEFVIAKKAAVAPGEQRHLGFEIDLGAGYGVYKNFDIGLNLGFLIPGEGLQVPSPHGPYAVRVTAGLKF